MGLLKQHFNNEYLTAPHEIIIPSQLCQRYKTIDCTVVYRYPPKNIFEIKTHIKKYLRKKSNETGKQDLQSIISNVTGFLACLGSGFDLPEIHEIVNNNQSISVALSSKNLCERILSSTAKTYQKEQFKHILRYVSPEVHGNRTTTLFTKKEEALNFIHSISPKLFQEVSVLLKKSVQKSKKSRIMRFIRFLHSFKEYLSTEQLKLIHKNGVSAFTENNGELWLLYLDTLPKEARGQQHTYNLRSVLNKLLAQAFDRNININEYLAFMLRYPHGSVHAEWSYQSCKYIHDNYPALFKDIKKIHHISLTRTDAFELQVTTVKSRISRFLIAIEKNDECLTEEQKYKMIERGLYAFTENSHDILKSLRQHIQHKCKISDIALVYGRAQQDAIDWCLETVGYKTTLSYPVAQMKRHHHQEKSSDNGYYTLTEAVELAFHIEKTFLIRNELTYYQTLALRIGRIFLKTAWNMTPVFELTTDDIFYFDSPIGGKKTPAVRLFKRRAGYTTQWHKFGLRCEDIDQEGIEIGERVRPAFQELIEIRDESSKLFRETLDNDHPYKNRIFLYQSEKYNTPKGIDNSILETLNKLLKEQGCQIRFSIQRIRKGGLNYIYRKVLSNFKKYNDAGQHSFEVFLKNYLKDDTTKSTAALTKATRVMGDYFHGRQLTDDIIILTEIPTDSRQTPNGSCVGGHDSDAAKIFQTENYKLHKENDTETTLCADFNACLFCPYYRLVADAEHVWRLLSYKTVVIDSMRSSISGLETAEMQNENIEILSNRVDEILMRVEEISPNAPTEGRGLFNEFGIHEDWELVAG